MRYLSLCLLVSTFAFSVSAAEAPRPAGVSGNERTTYVCNARSILGKRFSATGTDKVLTQEDALQRCEAYAFRCYRTGCDVTGDR